MTSTDLSFHPEAAKRFDERANQILPTIECLKAIGDRQAPDLHPIGIIREEDILEPPRLIFELDVKGGPAGVFWFSKGMRVGWVGSGFQPIKALIDSMAETKPLRERVSVRFVLETTCEWLSETLEGRQRQPFSKFLALRARGAIHSYEIWIPLFRTYSSKDFAIGDVSFRTFCREAIEEWWGRGAAKYREDPVNLAALNQKRSLLQAGLAACISISAERRKAAEVARAMAQDATALLRFLSPANFDSRLVSYCAPDSGAVRVLREVFMSNRRIDTVSESAHDERMIDWYVDQSFERLPGVIESLHRLALRRSTRYQENLYDALLLYSRQASATEISDKLIFALSALESMLLRDSNEPIQKNLGERMAFLIGQSMQQRKDVVRNVDAVYKIRSAFVHHGHRSRHVHTVDRFLVNAWATFAKLLDLSMVYRTKDGLIGALEDLKMS